MKQFQFIKTLINLNIYLFLLSCFATNYGFSQTVVWSEGFEGLTTSCGSASGSNLVTTTCTPSNWLTSKNYPWIASSTAFRTGTRCIRMTNNWTGWLITSGANLNANVTYNLTFYYKGICSSSCTAGMTVKVGVTNTQTIAPTTPTTVVNNGTQTSYTQFTYSYTPTVSGTYYFGLQMSSTIAGFDNGYIDDMQLSYNCSAPTTPTFTAGSTDICVGSTSTYTATSTGSIAYSILSGGASINSTTGAVSNVTSNYVVRATANTGCGTATTDRSVTVHTNPIAPIISNGGSLTFCEGQNVQLTSSYSTGNLWSSNQNTESIDVTASGNYSVVYTDPNGCSATSNGVTVQVNPLPYAQITAQGATSFCTGGSVVLNSSSTSGNLWSTSATTNSVTVNQSGDFSLVVTDANGCSASSNIVTVEVYPVTLDPIVAVSGSLSFCDGDQVGLYASANEGIVWSTSETTNSIIVYTAGTYYYTYTDIYGCSTTTLPVEVEVILSPSIPIINVQGSTSICEGSSVILSSSENTGNLWSTNETTNNIEVTQAGNFILTVTNSNGCSSSSEAVSIFVNGIPTPTISAVGATSFCEGGSVQLSSSEAAGNLWSNSNQSQSINVNNSGDYFVTVTDNNGCTGISNTISVMVYPLPAVPTISANGPITFCQGNSVVLTASSNGGNNWSNQENTNNITVNTAGSFTVTNTNSDGCSTTSLPIVVNVNSNPIAIASLTNENIITASPVGLIYQWINCLTNQQIVGAIALSYAATSNGSYSVIATNNFGCKDTSDCVTVSKVGIDDISHLSNVQLFPNPARNEVKVQFQSSILISQYDLKLYDTKGKLVKSERIMNGDSINIAEFNPGMYILEVRTEEGNSIHRLIKE
jgi:hypothetical protein